MAHRTASQRRGPSLALVLPFSSTFRILHRAGEDLAPRHGGGPKPLLQDPERALLRTAVAKQPDVTLAELQAMLAAHGSRAVSVSTLCRALQQLKLPRKKKVSAPPSGMTRNGRSSAS